MLPRTFNSLCQRCSNQVPLALLAASLLIHCVDGPIAINDLGDMVFSNTVRWQNGEISTWEPLPGRPSAGVRAFNEKGQFVGATRNLNELGSNRAFLWEDGKTTDLGSFAAAYSSSAWDINNHGQIVGEGRDADGSTLPFLWQDGVLTNFLGKTGVARAINDRGQIIGRSRNHPYIWDELRGEQDLNNLLDESSQGWKIWEATDINNQGAIVGWGINPSGVGAAFLATPVEVLLADLTDNGAVDFEDLTVLLSNWNQWGTSRQEGNLVNAGSTPVNFEDLTVLLAEWTGPAAAGAAPAAVPEPSSLLLALFGALALVLRRRGARS